MFEKEEKLDFHDLRIKPAVLSSIASRSEINPFYEYSYGEKHLPIFTAPMDTVISLKNIDCFHRNKIRGILPRGENEYFCGREPLFNAMGLDEFINSYVKINDKTLKIQSSKVNYILIDIANGHMEKLLNAVKIAKDKFKSQLILMVGNIANPETFVNLAKAGADYIRISIGNGNACITTKQTTVGYPMASLIMECRKEKVKHGLWNAQIVADGGMKDYSDVILALALGADYVMIGSLLNKSLESCADTYLFKRIKINQYSYFAKWLFKNKFKLTKKYRGMSTKEVQRKWKKAKLKTSEGISKKQNVEYTLEQWVENFEDYLRSAMSYSNAKELGKFIGYAEIIKISDKSYQRFNK